VLRFTGIREGGAGAEGCSSRRVQRSVRVREGGKDNERGWGRGVDKGGMVEI
jgi:hypothetical protein